MTDWLITTARPEHIGPIARHMRQADRLEVWASHRHTPQEALETSLEASLAAWTAFVEGEPAFMWGVAVHGCGLSGTGVPWLLGTDALLKVGREFLRQCRMYVEFMLELFPCLENYVHAENVVSMRWLKWCGFTLDQEPAERNGERFFMFWRANE